MPNRSDDLLPDPVIEAHKKDVDRTLIRENLRWAKRSGCLCRGEISERRKSWKPVCCAARHRLTQNSTLGIFRA